METLHLLTPEPQHLSELACAHASPVLSEKSRSKSWGRPTFIFSNCVQLWVSSQLYHRGLNPRRCGAGTVSSAPEHRPAADRKSGSGFFHFEDGKDQAPRDQVCSGSGPRAAWQPISSPLQLCEGRLQSAHSNYMDPMGLGRIFPSISETCTSRQIDLSFLSLSAIERGWIPRRLSIPVIQNSTVIPVSHLHPVGYF